MTSLSTISYVAKWTIITTPRTRRGLRGWQFYLDFKCSVATNFTAFEFGSISK